MLATGVNTPIGIRVLGRNLDDVVRGSEEVARVVKRIARRGRRRGRPDPGQALYRGPPRPRAGRAAGRERRRGQRADRDRPGRQGRHDDRRGPRAAPGRRPISAGPGARTKSRCGTSWSRPAARREGRARSRPRPTEPVRGRSRSPRSPRSASSRVPRRSRAKTGSCAITCGLNVQDRDAADLVAEARLAVARDAKLPDGVFLEWTGQFEHELRARRTLDPGRADRRRLDLPDPLLDLSRPGRRRADDAGRARCDRRRAVLPVAPGAEALGDGLGRLHRLLRHGDLDRDHHAGLPPRGGRARPAAWSGSTWASCGRPS